VREQNYLRMVRRNRFDGLIINPTQTDNAQLLTLGIPVVILGNGEDFPDLDSVGSASEDVVMEALDQLLAQGHQRIALITGRSHRRTPPPRTSTYHRFHQRHGLTCDPSLLIECDFSDRGGYEAMLHLLHVTPRPTAVLAGNDVLALAAIKAIQAMRLTIPGDISVIGMDDIYAASVSSPALTTIAKPKYEMGASAARLLLQRLNGDISAARHLRLPCQFVQRASTSFVLQPTRERSAY
jgi:LacI family transcriptional regulator